MSKMLSTYGLTRLPFSKDIPTSEMLDTEALQTARERLKAALEGRASAVVTGDSGSGKTQRQIRSRTHTQSAPAITGNARSSGGVAGRYRLPQ